MMLNIVKKLRVSIRKESPVLSKYQRRNIFVPPVFKFNYKEGLPPLFSKEALRDHYQTYLRLLNKTNELTEGSNYATLSLGNIMALTNNNPNTLIVHTYIGDTWNHEFFFKCLTTTPTEPSKYLLGFFNLHFDGFEKFQSIFRKHALALNGSGYTWLVDRDGKWEVINTFNSQSAKSLPGVTPLLVLDNWEHSYYRDWKDEKTLYVDAFWKAVDWEYVEKVVRDPKILDESETS